MQHAFTTRYSGRTRVLRNIVGVSLPLTLEELKRQRTEPREYIAIWDTGATNSGITKKVVTDLDLRPTGIVEVRHAQGKSLTNTYLVNVALPNQVMVGQLRVTEVELVPDDNVPEDEQPQILIGMDIIGAGDFAVTNFNNKTTLSFRMPSVSEIDFIPQAKEDNVLEGGNRHQRRAMRAANKHGQRW